MASAACTRRATHKPQLEQQCPLLAQLHPVLQRRPAPGGPVNRGRQRKLGNGTLRQAVTGRRARRRKSRGRPTLVGTGFQPMRKPIGQSAHVGPYARSASLRHGSLPGEDHGWFRLMPPSVADELRGLYCWCYRCHGRLMHRSVEDICGAHGATPCDVLRPEDVPGRISRDHMYGVSSEPPQCRARLVTILRVGVAVVYHAVTCG